jgi:hypothetical protein
MPHFAKVQPSTPPRGGLLQRKCSCGGTAGRTGTCKECEKTKLGPPTRLLVNEPGDIYEQDADRIAEQGPTFGARRLGEAPLRRDMDQRFSYDFSGVAVHAEAMSPLTLLGQARNALMASLGEGAGRIAIEIASAEAKGAEGVTVGRRVHLAPGRFDTQSHEGRVRLGHEVAHAIQQERGAGLSPELAPAHRAVLEIEAERAGQAFAEGRRFSVAGKAPTTAPLFRGPGEEQEAEVDRELDAAIQQVVDKHVARGVAIAKDRKERHDYILAHLEWREYDVPVDDRLRKTPAARQPLELWMRVLQMAFPTISREDATEVLRRTRMNAESVESDSIAEQIRTRAKIHFRTKYMSLLAKVYDEIGEDRTRASLYVDELLNAGPDMALEMFKDVGRGYYNGALSFAQGLADLPVAPVNLIQSIRGGEQIHTVDLSGLRADYRTSYGLHHGASIELGTVLGLTVVSGKLPIGAGGGAGATASTVSQASRAARLFSSWMKINAVTAGATAVVEAGKAVRDIARGYVIENGKKRPLTEDEILGRLGGIAFGVQAAKIGLRSTLGKSGSAPDVTIERTTPSKVQVSVPGEPNKLLIDDAGWRVVAADGKVLAQGSVEEGALLASKLSETQAAEPIPAATAPAANSPATSSGQTTPAQTAPRMPSRVAKMLQKLSLSVGMTVDELIPENRNIAGSGIGKQPAPALVEKAPVRTGHEAAPTPAPSVPVPAGASAEVSAVKAPVETPAAIVAEVPGTNVAPSPAIESQPKPAALISSAAMQPPAAPLPILPSLSAPAPARAQSTAPVPSIASTPIAAGTPAATSEVVPTTAPAATEISASQYAPATAPVQTQPAPPSTVQPASSRPRQVAGFGPPGQTQPTQPTAPEPQILISITPSRPVSGFARPLAPRPEPVPLTPGQTVFTEMPRAKVVQGNQPTYGSVAPAVEIPGQAPVTDAPSRRVQGFKPSPKDIAEEPGLMQEEMGPREYVKREHLGDRGAAGEQQSRYHVNVQLDEHGMMDSDFVLREGGRRSGSLFGKDEFLQAKQYFEQRNGPGSVKGAYGKWSSGDNLDTFNTRYKVATDKGFSHDEAMIEAARKTKTGEWARAAGFTRVNITKAEGQPGAFTNVEVAFTAEVQPPVSPSVAPTGIGQSTGSPYTPSQSGGPGSTPAAQMPPAQVIPSSSGSTGGVGAPGTMGIRRDQPSVATAGKGPPGGEPKANVPVPGQQTTKQGEQASPEPIVDEPTAPIPRNAPPPGEVIGEYRVNGPPGRRVGDTYEREIWGIKRIVPRTSAEHFEPLFRTFMQEARQAGATTLRVVGQSIVNQKVFRNVRELETMIKALGGEVHEIDAMTVEIIIPL